MNTLTATFNSVRQAEQARSALENLGVPVTQLTLGQLRGDSSGDATPHPQVPSGLGRVPDLLEPNSTPSRAYSPLQSADPALNGALLEGGSASVYPSADQDPNLGAPDYNRHELDAGLYQLEVDLSGVSQPVDALIGTLEGAGGRIQR